MSRVSKRPLYVPKEVNLNYNNDEMIVKGPKGTLSLVVNSAVDVKMGKDEEQLLTSITCAPKISGDAKSEALAGTMKSLINNMLIGVTQGFNRKLELVGVGYRAQMQGKDLQLNLGYSHPIKFSIPETIKVELPSNTIIIITGNDKQQVGQIAANIRALRPPEPYKGKGIKYDDERIIRKETKKK